MKKRTVELSQTAYLELVEALRPEETWSHQEIPGTNRVLWVPLLMTEEETIELTFVPKKPSNCDENPLLRPSH